MEYRNVLSSFCAARFPYISARAPRDAHLTTDVNNSLATCGVSSSDRSYPTRLN